LVLYAFTRAPRRRKAAYLFDRPVFELKERDVIKLNGELTAEFISAKISNLLPIFRKRLDSGPLPDQMTGVKAI